MMSCVFVDPSGVFFADLGELPSSAQCSGSAGFP